MLALIDWNPFQSCLSADSPNFRLFLTQNLPLCSPYESWTSVHQCVINQLSAAAAAAAAASLAEELHALWSSWRRGMASISAAPAAEAARVEPAGSEYVTPIQIYGRWLIHNFVERLSTWQSVLFHKRHVIHHHLQNVGDIHQKNFPFRKLLGKKCFRKIEKSRIFP